MKAMLLAAGLGTRLRPLTYELPKPMVPILGRPVIEHIMRLLARHGFDDVIANLHYFPDLIREHFGDGSQQGIKLVYSFEEELMGTAGGVRNVRDHFGGETFLVISRSEEHTSELQSRLHLVCRLLLEKKKKNTKSQQI